MAAGIDVRVDGRGVVHEQEVTEDASVRAECGLCDSQTDVVASLGTVFGCAACLRKRLDAMSVARWRLSEPRPPGLPWGKVSG